MALWAAYNGWMGESAVAALVQADSEAQARTRAVLILRRHEGTRAAKAQSDFEKRYAGNPRYTAAAKRDMAERLETKPRPSYWEVSELEQVPIPCVAVFGGVA